MSVKKTFHYFGFGSNLLRQRIQLMNKSATFITTGKLSDYKLNFHYPDVDKPSWCGSPATIEPTKGSHVWGVIWEMDIEDQPNLDRYLFHNLIS
jgi:gamma-glutamylcyclotransferase